MVKAQKPTLAVWFKRGEPWIWINAAAVATSVIAVVGLLSILAINGFAHFWPSSVVQATYQSADQSTTMTIIGEIVETQDVSARQLISSGVKLEDDQKLHQRMLIKTGNRDITGADFGWYLQDFMTAETYPPELIVLERHEWGNFYGRLLAVKENGEIKAQGSEAIWTEFSQRLARANDLHKQIDAIEKVEIMHINHDLERLRLKERKVNLRVKDDNEKTLALADITAGQAELNARYEAIQAQLVDLYAQINRDSVDVQSMNGTIIDVPMAKIVRLYKPNAMTLPEKFGFYFSKLGEFLTQDPREPNPEGGIFPAIFGTITMVLLMSIMVTPFGVIAAVYLREYASQGWITRMVRIAVNNLAGVPSIVYGVFGLGFFIYFIGENIDHLFFGESLPTPTFGTPGLLWASLTLALLTVPVVIVATEEGLSRIPRAVREGSLALGATKAETLWRVVIPMASPAIMTGLILAVARAAGEVAPLMLVGVVKLAPALPIDGNFPYVHLDQKFMHLGFHIYDVGFQSPNIEAARPLVYATALLLVIVIATLNFSAVSLRNHLREKYKSLEH
jgi:phosphate transport system permease protein